MYPKVEGYEVIKVIGEGSFGRVFQAQSKATGQILALKLIRKLGKTARELENLQRECEILQTLRHPNIIQVMHTFETSSEVVVVMEYAEKELFQLLEREGRLGEDVVRQIAGDLVSALYYLHSHRILHRDLKPANILVGQDGKAKLCDFGFARCMSLNTFLLTSIKGTPLYMAPEIIEEKPYDHNADLWSLGCILYELVTGSPPFNTTSIIQLVKKITGEAIPWPGEDVLGPECRGFLEGLLQRDPDRRLSWPHLLHHPFVCDRVKLSFDGEPGAPLTFPLSESQEMKREAQRRDLEARSLNRPKILVKAMAKVVDLRAQRTDGPPAARSDDGGKTEEDEKTERASEDEGTVTAAGNQRLVEAATLDPIEASMGALTLRSFGLGDSKAVETEEWLSFLRKTFDECLGSVENLADPSFLAVLLGPLRSSQVSPKVVSRIALLFSVPLVHPCTHESREKVIQAYLDSRVVANLFYAARHVLQSAESEPTDEEWETLEDLVELLSHLVHLDAEFAVALCDAVCVMNAYGTVRRLVTSTWCRAGRDVPRISANTLAILAQILRVNPENSAVVQEVLWDSKTGAMAVPISTLMHHGEELVSSRAGTLARFASILLPHLAPMLA